jgi:hypothetical protein
MNAFLTFQTVPLLSSNDIVIENIRLESEMCGLMGIYKSGKYFLAIAGKKYC